MGCGLFKPLGFQSLEYQFQRGFRRVIGRNRVVITGLGVLAANGIGKEAFWKSLLAGESGIGPITQFDASEIPWQIAGEIDGFSPTDFIDPSLKPKRQSRNTQIAAAATVMALEDAKLSMDSLKKVEPVQITLGISLGGSIWWNNTHEGLSKREP